MNLYSKEAEGPQNDSKGDWRTTNSSSSHWSKRREKLTLQRTETCQDTSEMWLIECEDSYLCWAVQGSNEIASQLSKRNKDTIINSGNQSCT